MNLRIRLKKLEQKVEELAKLLEDKKECKASTKAKKVSERKPADAVTE